MDHSGVTFVTSGTPALAAMLTTLNAIVLTHDVMLLSCHVSLLSHDVIGLSVDVILMWKESKPFSQIQE